MKRLQQPTMGIPTDGYENTDWTSPIYKTTMMHQHNLSVSGGTDKTKYFISGGFLRHNGIIKDHKNQRGNFHSISQQKSIETSMFS